MCVHYLGLSPDHRGLAGQLGLWAVGLANFSYLLTSVAICSVSTFDFLLPSKPLRNVTDFFITRWWLAKQVVLHLLAWCARSMCEVWAFPFLLCFIATILQQSFLRIRPCNIRTYSTYTLYCIYVLAIVYLWLTRGIHCIVEWAWASLLFKCWLILYVSVFCCTIYLALCACSISVLFALRVLIDI